MWRTSEYLHDLSVAHGNINVVVFRAILMRCAVSGALAGSALWWGQAGSAVRTSWDATVLVCFACSYNTVVFLQTNTDMESCIWNDGDLEVFWIRNFTVLQSTMPKICKGASKNKLNLSIEALQSTNWETDRLSRSCHDQSVSGLASVAFVYISSLKMAALL